MGWTLDDLDAVPLDKYAVLVDWLSEQFQARVRHTRHT